MNFSEAESYLYSLGNEVSAMKLGLENIRTLLAALGNPQNNFLKIQVAGTNGKGSVCAFLDSICLSADVKTGLFTSPHLISITERIRINGTDITEEDFAKHATRVRETAESLLDKGEIEYLPTFFEQVTAIALAAFAQAKVELVILETGLGGRLDATTAANAEIAAITQIDYDHQEYLGETLAEIAAEKAAIIRPDSIAIIGEQPAEASRVITEHCRKSGISPKYADFVNVRYQDGTIVFGTDLAEYMVGELGLAGRHQIGNAKIALLVAEELAHRFNILQSDIVLGLKNARHPGRMEFSGRYLFDGAHNAAGAIALREYLSEFVTQPITLIFGAMREKDITEIAAMLFPLASQIVLTKPDNLRALTSEEFFEQIPANISRSGIFITGGVSDALDIAATVTPNDGIILVTGSLYLIGEVKRLISSR